jgi:hypothetical protein
MVPAADLFVKGTAYSDQLYTSGGKSPYTWSATGLPIGLSIRSSTGLISEPPASTGTFTAVGLGGSVSKAIKGDASSYYRAA